MSICRVEDQSSGHYDFENDRVLKVFSAPCGQTVLRSDLMPQWYGHVATPEPVGRLIRLSEIKNENGKRVAHNAFPKGEFIRSTDPFFRPVWSESGPDGCLYFADMYRGIIQEKTWFPHQGDHIWVKRYKRVKEWGMLKVFRHGRIYRLVPNKAKPTSPLKLKNLSSKQLVGHLTNSNGWVRDNAQKLLVYNKDSSAVKPLKELFANSSLTNSRIAALWTLRGLDAIDAALVLTALADKEERVRLAGIRLAEPFLEKGNASIAKSVVALADNASPDVAMQLVLSLNPDWPNGKEMRDQVAAKYSEHPLITRYLKEEERGRQRHLLGGSAKAGLKIYQTSCIVCHGQNGHGVKQADSVLAPRLRKNRWFVGRRVDIISRILLKGETGPIGGETYGEGLMPPHEHTYNDKEIADVMNYVGLSWNGWKGPVKAAEVGAIRAEIKDRKAPYTEKELLEIK